MKKKKRALTESQIEILRWLARGQRIFFDERGKFRISAEVRADGTKLTAATGHADTGYDGSEHLYRPTVELLLDMHLLKGVFDMNQRPYWVLNTENEEYKEELDIIIMEGALGVTRAAYVK